MYILLRMRVGYEIYKIALTKGILLRPIGNILYVIPPYVIKLNCNLSMETL